MANILAMLGGHLTRILASWGLVEWVNQYFTDDNEEDSNSIFKLILIGVMGIVIILMGYKLYKK